MRHHAPQLQPRWSSLRRCCSVVAAGLALLVSAPPSSLAETRASRPAVVIACFHEKVDRFTAEAHPRRCDIAGYRGKDFVEVPARGMHWGHWGANPTRAAYGVDTRNGIHVRIIAHLPITCDDGRTWYSRVVVVFLGNGRFFGLHLPTCAQGETLSRGGDVLCGRCAVPWGSCRVGAQSEARSRLARVRLSKRRQKAKRWRGLERLTVRHPEFPLAEAPLYRLHPGM
jgi:hypothetical protein